MIISQNQLFKERKYLFGLIFLSLIPVIYAAVTITGNNEFDTARREILLRRIGHELLLQSGDSVSRVLPLKKITENEYQIRFENQLTFSPDSLVNTARRVLANDALANEYVVNVTTCGTDSVAYGYAISKNKKNDIVPCRGRKQPRACYMVNIKFKPSLIATAKTGYLLGSIPILALVGFMFFKLVRPRKTLPDDQLTNTLSLGAINFDAKKRQLITSDKTIDLTATEARILLIFAQSPSETIDRSRLQKEIWEDEGIIVGRSLDMFISKLRRKLECDPHLKIIVIRGKGYRLEINS